jgi:hypothetical protein
VVALAIAPPVPPLDDAESAVPTAPADEPEPVEAPVAVAEVAEDVPPDVDEEIRAALVADLRARQHSALEAETPPVVEIDMTEPPPPEPENPLEHMGEPTFVPAPAAGADRTPARPARRRAMVLAGIAAGLVALLAGAWHFRDAFGAGDEDATPLAAAPAAVAPEDVPASPAGQPLAYSVAIEAHKHLPTATARVRTLSMAQPRIGFYTTPLLEDSVLWYRVMAGPVADSVAAAGVLKELLASGIKTAGNDWDIRSTPFAFLIGVFDIRDDAERRMAELQQVDIPSYVVVVPYTGGTERFHLYAGAFVAAAEADVMREFLNSVGIPDSLVLRVGSAPS